MQNNRCKRVLPPDYVQWGRKSYLVLLTALHFSVLWTKRSDTTARPEKPPHSFVGRPQGAGGNCCMGWCFGDRFCHVCTARRATHLGGVLSRCSTRNWSRNPGSLTSPRSLLRDWASLAAGRSAPGKPETLLCSSQISHALQLSWSLQHCLPICRGSVVENALLAPSSVCIL